MVTACSQTWQQNIDQWDLSAGTSQAIDLVTACSWPSAVVYASVTGQCAVIGTPYAATDRNLANLAEFTIPGSGNQDFYDLSSVNAYTIPMSINAPTGCSSITCSIGDIRHYPLVPFLASIPDGTAGLGPTAGTRQFQAACPQAYSCNLDDATSTFTCPTGSDYEVVFCP
ncbi:hypothetical protein AXG93_2277s1000 [Marchantia polymorpha subsp. ruderalis]|uniref:Thaumatin-like protein n=1 Tax=Marchantia polymorpha subsp. ruderalis TaxID=1480154 RepID=A0A176W1L2_MARPO|nr:hypothetical protein AXG93_2277s1000 [Marchantia polymorpha subsp. ruderalis]